MASRRPRDSQRSKVYSAEAMAYGDDWGKRFETMGQIERYIERLESRAYIQKKYKHVGKSYYWDWDGRMEISPISVQVKDGRGRRNAVAFGTRAVAFPKWARSEAVILHEMAHIYTSRQYGSSKTAGHGWQWAAIYIDLVRHMMGKEYADRLKAAFKANGVRFKEPVKRTITPERRAELQARMEMVRAARQRPKEGG